MTRDIVQLVANTYLMNQSRSVDAESNASADLLILGCLLVDIDLDVRAGILAVVVDEESTGESTYSTSDYRYAESFIACS